METKDNTIIPALTGLRAVAASMIFFYHWFFNESAALPLALRAPFDVGYVAVPIFFALSGFLLTVRYYQAFEDSRTTFSTYLIRRFTRIYPLYFVVLTMFVMALNRPIQMVPKGAGEILIAYTLTQALFPDLLLLGTQVGWTLTLEALFYLIAPSTIRWLGRAKSLHVISLRALALGLVAILLGLLIARLPLVKTLPDTLIGAPDTYIMHFTIFGHLPDFVAGVVCGFLFLRRSAFPKLETHAGKLVWLGAIGGYMLCVALDVIPTELGSPLNRTLGFGIAACSSGLILGLACDRSRSHPISRVLGSRAMVYLGTISYALFLIQLTEPCQWLYWILLGPVQNRVLRAILLYVVSTPIAAMLYALFERPADRWLRARMART